MTGQAEGFSHGLSTGCYCIESRAIGVAVFLQVESKSGRCEYLWNKQRRLNKVIQLEYVIETWKLYCY